jgi:hypothetical protein
MNYPLHKVNTGQTDVVCDDRVTLSLQYSTQWDSLCHIGSLHDAHGDRRVEATYYNGYRAQTRVRGHFDYLRERAAVDAPYGAHVLWVSKRSQRPRCRREAS